MSFLTCLTCQLAFYESESQKVHYKSDWHKYNLKRKIVQLPPVSVEEFKAKVEAQQALVSSSFKKNIFEKWFITYNWFGLKIKIRFRQLVIDLNLNETFYLSDNFINSSSSIFYSNLYWILIST